MLKNLTREFGLRLPLIVAPLGGGPSTPELVAASCNAGAMGSVAGAYLSPSELRSSIQRARELTSRPFAVNLFTPMPKPEVNTEQIEKAVQATQVYRNEMKLVTPKIQPPFHQDFEAQFSIILETRPAVFSFVFGLLEQEHLRELKKLGIFTMGSATTLDEGLALQASGVDVVVAQGVEAGGHRAMFDPFSDDPMISTFTLTRILASKLHIPVVAAGGIMDGYGIVSALALGAQAVQMGTAFLACDEAATSRPYRHALVSENKTQTRLTRSFSGRWARGLENRFMREIDAKSEAILPFPVQNAFTRDLRKAAVASGNSEFLSLWAGQGVSMLRSGPAAQLIETLIKEMGDSMKGINQTCNYLNISK